jgi:DNA-binding NarL/FixJ family response regulator
VIAEEFPALRHVMRSALRQNPAFQVVAEVSDGLGAVQRVRERRPDSVVLSIRLPLLNGIRVAKAVRMLAPLFVSEQPSPKLLFGLGVPGYIDKSQLARNLRAVQKQFSIESGSLAAA